jgi:hypothetical protein
MMQILASAGKLWIFTLTIFLVIESERRNMPKKTYTIVAYYKEKFTYTVEAATEEEAKEIALENQADWERMDEFINHEPPVIVQVMEE